MVVEGVEEAMDQGFSADEMGDIILSFADSVPPTPDSSVFIGEITDLLSSAASRCVSDSDSSPEEVEKIEPGGLMLKRKAPENWKSVASPAPAPTKRQRVDRVEEDSDDKDSEREGKELSRSAKATRKLRKEMKSGELVVDEQKRDAYEKRCMEVDANARFRYQKKWEVLHSKCKKWFAMSEPYNTTRFRRHVSDCRSKGQNGLIDDYFKRQDKGEEGIAVKATKPGARKHIVVGGHRLKTSPGIPAPKLQVCCGIGKEHHDRIPIYLSRALTNGAGSRSESAITTMLFGNNIKYSQLDEKSRNDVLAMQVKLRSWTICRELQVVYSTKCLNCINTGSLTTCNECLALLKLDTLKKALRMEPPSLETAKFTPRHQYNGLRDLGISYAKIKGLARLLEDVSIGTNPCCVVSHVEIAFQDSETSVWVRFANGVLEGKYKNQKLLLGLVHAAVERTNRDERHVGLQNFSYSSFLLQASHVCSVLSPEVYRFLQTQMQLPTPRHHQ